MNLFGVMEVSGSAMLAERQRAEVVTTNLANAETTRTPQGGPYQRQHVVFGAAAPASFATELASAGGGFMPMSMHDPRGQGVKVQAVVGDSAPPVRRYDPSHPDADAQGFVNMPAINPVEEMADLMGAARSYELNATAVQATRGMIQQSMDLLK
jgi:flagellar basal-body rod protein FlgC